MTMYQTGTGDPVRMFVERQHRLVAPKYNLLSVSEQPVEDPHWVGGIEYWPPVKPYVAATELECLEDWSGFEPRDIPAGFPAGIGDAFQVHSGVQCRALGISEDELRARAITALGSGDVPFVEDRLWATANPAIMSDTTETVVGTATPLALAIGRLEAWLNVEYASLGVLHLPRWLAARAGELNLWWADGQTARTKLGTPIVFGNYPGTGPADESPAAGQVWIAATGDVTTYRTPLEALTDEGSAWFEPGTNIGTAIVTRDYLVTFDDLAGAALVAL